MESNQQVNIDLGTLKLDELKAIAKENNIEVTGTAKQPFIDAISEFGATDGNVIVIPEFILDAIKARIEKAANQKGENKTEKADLPAGTSEYSKQRNYDGEWREIGKSYLTEGQAKTLNSQSANSNMRYVKQ